MAQRTKQITKQGTCPTHGSVLAVKEVPAFSPPGLFFLVSSLLNPMRPYKCPQCGQRVS
jgi:rRNA maturation protein Nop10